MFGLTIGTGLTGLTGLISRTGPTTARTTAPIIRTRTVPIVTPIAGPTIPVSIRRAIGHTGNYGTTPDGVASEASAAL